MHAIFCKIKETYEHVKMYTYCNLPSKYAPNLGSQYTQTYWFSLINIESSIQKISALRYIVLLSLLLCPIWSQILYQITHLIQVTLAFITNQYQLPLNGCFYALVRLRKQRNQSKGIWFYTYKWGQDTNMDIFHSQWFYTDTHHHKSPCIYIKSC